VTAARVTMVNSEDNPGSVSGGGARGIATGEPAVIESLVPISFTVLQDDVGPNNASNARNEVVSTFEGVRVTILPFIATESLTVRVEAQVNSVVGLSPATGTPLVAERRANTMVNLADGIPLVLGGLEKTTNQDVRVGIPLLKEVPILQYLVSVERTLAATSKVYVVVTPRLKDATVPELPPVAIPN
jgi:type II secretory pathway component GspD/PulD (secretin)